MNGQKILLLLLFIPFLSIGQEVQQADWEHITQNTQKINDIGMKVLLGWSVLNMGSGTAGYLARTGEERYFHQMNGFWNVVNAGIAIGALSGMESPASFSDAIRSGQQMENILLFNGGLDVGYIFAGGLLLERGKRKSSDWLKGYGKSLMLQGGFLLSLDGVLYFLNHSENQKLIEILEKVEAGPNGVGLSIPF